MIKNLGNMKSIKFLSVFVFILCSFGCEKDDKVIHQINYEGVVIATPYLWKTSLHNGLPYSNSYIKYPVIYKNSILVPTTSDGSRRNLSAIDVKSGKVLWCWDDSFCNGTRYFNITDYAIYDNLLIIQPGSSYCINLNNGTTFWKFIRDRSLASEVTIMGDKFFNFGPIFSYEGTEMAAYIGDIEYGENLTPKIRVDLPDDIDYPDGNWGPKFKGGVIYLNNLPDNDKLLLVSHFTVLADWTYFSYFSLYHTETEEWVWENQSINAKPYETFDAKPQIYNGKIYANVGFAIVCHDLVTGEQLWRRDFNNDFLFSGFLIEGGRLIANNEDCFAVCLDAETGHELWRVRTAGTSSRMSYLNGIVYFVGGSQPYLFAIEASTGKIVWKINTALIGEPRGTQFKYNAVYPIPAKDGQPAKVIALSNLYAYCFKAER